MARTDRLQLEGDALLLGELALTFEGITVSTGRRTIARPQITTAIASTRTRAVVATTFGAPAAIGRVPTVSAIPAIGSISGRRTILVPGRTVRTTRTLRTIARGGAILVPPGTVTRTLRTITGRTIRARTIGTVNRTLRTITGGTIRARTIGTGLVSPWPTLRRPVCARTSGGTIRRRTVTARPVVSTSGA
ncbi:MAG TPA: hypothetical protein VNJ54_12800 [Plantibacter sp.]|uniref:hypothetical protein n=1 Tax=unclassified Plantibacter TaxID=2624265 RepID=UPI002CD2C18C|nr:hypothetical protein [Plantibacter sp.]